MSKHEFSDETINLANKYAADNDCDIILYNGAMGMGPDHHFVKMAAQRAARKTHAVLILVTPGGSADSAYRVAKRMQIQYKNFDVVVSGWCKSAGTILCTAARKLYFGQLGELGPIDVQIRREDEIGERDSGLSIDSAFDSLRSASFRLFEQTLFDIKEGSGGSITYKTAAEIASSMTVGMVSPIFSHLDPIKIGETYRSVRISEEYVRRLNIKFKNVKTKPTDRIDTLLRGYPSHGFVIDLFEALQLFKQVDVLSGDLYAIVESIGEKFTVYPVQDQYPIIEYVNTNTTGASGGKPATAKPKTKPKPTTKPKKRTTKKRKPTSKPK